MRIIPLKRMRTQFYNELLLAFSAQSLHRYYVQNQTIVNVQVVFSYTQGGAVKRTIFKQL